MASAKFEGLNGGRAITSLKANQESPLATNRGASCAAQIRLRRRISSSRKRALPDSNWPSDFRTGAGRIGLEGTWRLSRLEGMEINQQVCNVQASVASAKRGSLSVRIPTSSPYHS